jgi:hypothetical protein
MGYLYCTLRTILRTSVSHAHARLSGFHTSDFSPRSAALPHQTSDFTRSTSKRKHVHTKDLTTRPQQLLTSQQTSPECLDDSSGRLQSEWERVFIQVNRIFVEIVQHTEAGSWYYAHIPFLAISCRVLQETRNYHDFKRKKYFRNILLRISRKYSEYSESESLGGISKS